MRKLIIGYMFILLDISVSLDIIQIGLIPDFVGYIFVLKAIKDLEFESDRFLRIRPAAIGAMIYLAFLYIMDMFGISATIEPIDNIFSLLGTAYSLYISYSIIKGLRDIEVDREVDLNTAKLLTVWKLLAAAQIISHLVVFWSTIAFIVYFMSLALSIWFLIELNRTKNYYEVD